ncbi:MAG: hypothetical protein COA43_07460 [Robiginitomaculum sp.]|nr:MAG: hypothetical protein COA43_07460 [Robiginitomaculum sp.]
MSDPTLKCPDCGTTIKLNESLAGPLLAQARDEFTRKLRTQNDQMATQTAKIESERAAMASKLAQGIAAERQTIAGQESQKARQAAAKDLAAKAQETETLRQTLKENDIKLAKAQTAEAAILKERRAIEEQKRELDLTIEKRVQAEAQNIRDKAKQEQEHAYHLKLKEQEHTMTMMNKQISDLKRRAEQGSQQNQGEVLEIELEDVLRRKFPFDEILPVAKGINGGDILQKVMSPNGKLCGTMLWETKRTKTWHATWLPKLKNDQREAGADIAILMSTTLPKEFEKTTFTQMDGIWITGFDSAMSLAGVLRMQLIEIANVYAVRDGQETKAELIYDYLTGTKFKHRVEAIVEKFEDMREDLVKEKRIITKQWAKREQQIEGVINATIGMYGDLEGIAGKSMPEISGLEFALLED